MNLVQVSFIAIGVVGVLGVLGMVAIISGRAPETINWRKNVDKKALKVDKSKKTLSVIDQGIGFSEKNTDKIFNRFYSNRPEKFGEHSGLGLNIVKNLVELHNGEIIATNNINKGAKVEIILPAI